MGYGRNSRALCVFVFLFEKILKHPKSIHFQTKYLWPALWLLWPGIQPYTYGRTRYSLCVLLFVIHTNINERHENNKTLNQKLIAVFEIFSLTKDFKVMVRINPIRYKTVIYVRETCHRHSFVFWGMNNE